ncbi:hypothetical protein [Maribacter halichondriae]|uniref:hypothetical protein n=1 Tax=Maribacter halichondriae TaxID=2980554 RepID=UPI0023596E9C|nr:hypothetical protein [Maribacter sp. Hal144]
MKNIIILSGLFLFLFTSCAHRLVGTWNVQKYERKTPGEEGMSVSNIGKITFDKNGSGEKNLDYSLLGISAKDVTPFQWSATDQFVTIEGENSEITKTWIYIENKSKFQKWQSTDGANNVQTLELAKD